MAEQVNIGTIAATLQADVRNFLSGLQRAQNELDDLTRTAGQAARRTNESLSSIDRASQRTARVIGQIRTAFATIAGAAVVRQIFQTSIAFEDLNSSLSFLLGNAREASRALNRIGALSDQLGGSVLDLSRAFTQLVGATQGTNFTLSEVDEIFLALVTAGRVMGTSNAALSQSFFGLSQAAASANLQMEEVRQITDPIPGLLARMASATGRTTGEFRAFVATGKAVPRDVLLPFARAVNENFRPAVDGLGDRTSTELNRVVNAWQNLIRALGDTGAIGIAADALRLLSGAIRSVGNIASTVKKLPAILEIDSARRQLNNLFNRLQQQVNRIRLQPGQVVPPELDRAIVETVEAMLLLEQSTNGVLTPTRNFQDSMQSLLDPLEEVSNQARIAAQNFQTFRRSTPPPRAARFAEAESIEALNRVLQQQDSDVATALRAFQRYQQILREVGRANLGLEGQIDRVNGQIQVLEDQLQSLLARGLPRRDPQVLQLTEDLAALQQQLISLTSPGRDISLNLPSTTEVDQMQDSIAALLDPAEGLTTAAQEAAQAFVDSRNISLRALEESIAQLDQFKAALQSIGSDFDAINPKIQLIQDLLQRHFRNEIRLTEDQVALLTREMRQLERAAQNVGEKGGMSFSRMRRSAEALRDSIQTPLQNFTEQFNLINRLRTQIDPLTDQPFINENEASTALQRIRVEFFKTTTEGQLLISLTQNLSSAFQEAFRGIAQGTQTLGQAFRRLGQTILASIANTAIQTALRAISQALIISAAGGAGGGAGGTVSVGATAPGGGGQIFQHGGIVTRPTRGIVGEAGPEAVIPLRRLSEILAETLEKMTPSFSAQRQQQIAGPPVINVLPEPRRIEATNIQVPTPDAPSIAPRPSSGDVAASATASSVQAIQRLLQSSTLGPQVEATPSPLASPDTSSMSRDLLTQNTVILSKLNQTLQRRAQDTSPMLGLQTGGIVTRPTRAVIGEAGPEAVIPLNRGGVPVQVTNILVDSRQEAEQVRQQELAAGRQVIVETIEREILAGTGSRIGQALRRAQR